jgi:hypothetical protein
MEQEVGPFEPADLKSSMQYVLYHMPYKRIAETISGSRR